MQVLDFVYQDLLESFQKDTMPDLQAQSARALGQAIAECGRDCLSHDDLVLGAKAMQQVLIDSRERTEEAMHREGEGGDDEEEDDEQGDMQVIEDEEDLADQIEFALSKCVPCLRACSDTESTKET